MNFFNLKGLKWGGGGMLGKAYILTQQLAKFVAPCDPGIMVILGKMLLLVLNKSCLYTVGSRTQHDNGERNIIFFVS